ncbi:unnamed protein product [Gongylonema pulchrum]|uniref:Myotubularin phosphatase domain-containing protein n=1 Tax=Gongylonema pulchrum TaxID=637853 RepID=A0A183DAK8_9BILA|nr:unnamed protein product [Gongylonema pulchrum]
MLFETVSVILDEPRTEKQLDCSSCNSSTDSAGSCSGEPNDTGSVRVLPTGTTTSSSSSSLSSLSLSPSLSWDDNGSLEVFGAGSPDSLSPLSTTTSENDAENSTSERVFTRLQQPPRQQNPRTYADILTTVCLTRYMIALKMYNEQKYYLAMCGCPPQQFFNPLDGTCFQAYQQPPGVFMVPLEALEAYMRYLERYVTTLVQLIMLELEE